MEVFNNILIFIRFKLQQAHLVCSEKGLLTRKPMKEDIAIIHVNRKVPLSSGKSMQMERNE